MTVPLLWVLAAVSVVEASAVHIVLSARHLIAAWLVTFVSAAGAIWCGLTARSLASRPLVRRRRTEPPS